MRNRTAALVAFLFAVGAAHAQGLQTMQSTLIEAAASVRGINDAAMVRSARASKVIGSKVYNGDAAIGQIEDILVDFNQATVAAVILSVGSFLHLGDKLVAVPASAVMVGREAKFTTDLTKEQLAESPAFDFGKLR